MRFLILLSSFLFIGACSEPEFADPITVDLNGKMSANLNGEDWSSGSENSASINFLSNEIHVEGYLKEEGIIRSHITLIIKETTSGTYNSQTSKGVFYDVQNKKTYISDNECSIDIIELDIEAKYINGRFSFNGIDLNSGESIQVINGEFNNVNLSTVE